MDVFQAVLSAALQIFQLELSIFGFTFSLWQVFLFDAFLDVVVWILREVFLDG